MSPKDTIITAVTVVIMSAAIVDYVKTAREERRKRAEIDANMAREIRAIDRASDRIVARIEAGEYDDLNLERLWNDQEFETLIAYNEQ